MNIKVKAVFIILVITLTGFVFVYSVLNHSSQQQIEKTQSLLVQEAQAHFQTIKLLKIWHKKFGGVFKDSEDKSDYRFDIISLNPKNHFNRAFGESKKALMSFETDKTKKHYYKFNNQNMDFTFIGAMHVKQECLRCHKNYQIGDVRGGIKINIPLESYQQTIKQINSQFNQWLTYAVIIFIIFTLVSICFVLKLIKQKDAITELNNSLEEKIKERTAEVKNLYDREKYLRDLLENLSDMNEALISSYSVTSIIQASLERIKKHPNYKLIAFSRVQADKLHIRSKFGDKYNHLTKQEYAVNELAHDEILKSIYLCLKNKTWHMAGVSPQDNLDANLNRADDYKLSASIALPLSGYGDDDELYILAIWTDRTDGFDAEEIKILESVAKDIAKSLTAYKQRQLTVKLQQDQITNYEETILAFVDMIEQRDAYTAGHTLRVAKYSRIIAVYLSLPEENIQKLEKAAILHDIGKIATPDTILLKPGRLSGIEYNLIKHHVVAGYNMLSKVKMYSELAEIIKYHHEHYDGNGYPYGVKQDEIPMEAHILILADAFDAMTTNRIYKPRKSVQDTLLEIEKLKGKQFHPTVVDAALTCLTNVSLCETNQLPNSELEKQRFSYFFTDSMTGLFNLTYLKLLFNQTHDFKSVYLYRLLNFTQYNKEYGWDEGDKLIVNMAKSLTKSYPEDKVFRIHGDDFVVISTKPLSNCKTLDNNLSENRNTISIDCDKFSCEQHERLREFCSFLHIG